MSPGNGFGPDGAGPGDGAREGGLRLGGMALRNGLLIHGPSSWAIAARGPDGRIEVASGPKLALARGRVGRIPLLRGPLRLAEALTVVPIARARLGSARLPFEDRAVIGATVASALTSAALRRVARREGSASEAAVREGLVSLLGALPALAALRDADLAAYHGVEHKAIGGYETGQDPALVPKEHDRCGSNLVAPLILLSVAGQAALERLAPKRGPLARGLVTVAGVGIAVELFAYAERRPESALGRAVHRPGHEIQRLVSTREPTAEQLEVGAAALDEILRVERSAPPPAGTARI
ncbi:MAG: DUF1385 domain-containing protein [Solirubrobacterales bacterium]